MGTGSEAIKRTLYGRQRPTDGGQLHQSQFDRTGIAAHQVKDSLTILFFLFLHLPRCFHRPPAHSLHVLSSSTVELAQHQSFPPSSPPTYHFSLYLLLWTCRLTICAAHHRPPVPEQELYVHKRTEQKPNPGPDRLSSPLVCHAVIDTCCVVVRTVDTLTCLHRFRIEL